MKDVKELDLSAIDQIVQIPASEEMLTKPCGFVVEVRRLQGGDRTRATIIGVNAGTGVVVSDPTIRLIVWPGRLEAVQQIKPSDRALFALDETGKAGIVHMAPATREDDPTYHFYIGADAERLRFELYVREQGFRMIKVGKK